MKFQWEFKHFHLRKCTWICCLRNVVHFVSQPQLVYQALWCHMASLGFNELQNHMDWQSIQSHQHYDKNPHNSVHHNWPLLLTAITYKNIKIRAWVSNYICVKLYDALKHSCHYFSSVKPPLLEHGSINITDSGLDQQKAIAAISQMGERNKRHHTLWYFFHRK